MDKKRQQQAYENYVKQKTPVHNLPANMTKAFVTGGAICVLGQGILNICEKAGLDKDISGGWCSMLLVFLSAVLTGFNVYPRIAKWGGAGALVPITGFANSVAASAIEYQKEGQNCRSIMTAEDLRYVNMSGKDKMNDKGKAKYSL